MADRNKELFWESIPTLAVFTLIHDGERWSIGGQSRSDFPH
jgi:hypothetical protein